MELFIAKLFGLYFIIVSLIVLIRRQSFLPTVKDMLQNRPMLMALATIELIAGIALVLVFPRVAFDMVGLISLIGYILIIEGIMYFSASQRFINRFILRFNIPQWYVISGIVGLVMGVYLAGRGFGIF